MVKSVRIHCILRFSLRLRMFIQGVKLVSLKLSNLRFLSEPFYQLCWSFFHTVILWISFRNLGKSLKKAKCWVWQKLKRFSVKDYLPRVRHQHCKVQLQESDVVDAASGDSAPPNRKKCVFKNIQSLMHHFKRVFRVFYTNIIASYELSLELKHLAQDSRIHLMYLLIVLLFDFYSYFEFKICLFHPIWWKK